MEPEGADGTQKFMASKPLPFQDKWRSLSIASYLKKVSTITFLAIATYLLTNPTVLVAMIGLLTALVYLATSLIDHATAHVPSHVA